MKIVRGRQVYLGRLGDVSCLLSYAVDQKVTPIQKQEPAANVTAALKNLRLCFAWKWGVTVTVIAE